jgi:hypothetical protein
MTMDGTLPALELLKAKIGFDQLYSGIDPKESKRHFFNGAEVFDALIRGKRPRLIIEVGSWMGHSAIHMSQTARRETGPVPILCVDTWLGSAEHYFNEDYLEDMSFRNGRPDFYRSFLGNVVFHGAERDILPISLPSHTAYEVFAKLGLLADLIYIDAGHGYDDVMSDIGDYRQLLAPGGIMFGDDYFYKPLKRAVDDYARANGLHVASYGDRGHKWVMFGSLEEANEVMAGVPLAAFV